MLLLMFVQHQALTHLDEKTIRSIINEYGMHNADVLFRRFMSVTRSKKELQGIFSVSDAAMYGMSRTSLSKAERAGEIERIARGIYRKPDAPHIPYPEIEILLKRKTRFVVALQSALRLHNFTTAMPSSLWIALSRGGRVPSVDFPLDHVFLSGLRGALTTFCRSACQDRR